MGTWIDRKHANVVLITKNNFLLKISQNDLGNQEMIRATQFSTMGDPVGDPWIWAYPQHWIKVGVRTGHTFCHRNHVHVYRTCDMFYNIDLDESVYFLGEQDM